MSPLSEDPVLMSISDITNIVPTDVHGGIIWKSPSGDAASPTHPPRPQPTDGGGQDPVYPAGVPDGAPHPPRVDEGLPPLLQDPLDLEQGDHVEHEHGEEDGDEEDGEGVAGAVGEEGLSPYENR